MVSAGFFFMLVCSFLILSVIYVYLGSFCLNVAYNSLCIPEFCQKPELYRSADKSLARPTSRCILFDGENISFDISLVLYIYINSTNIPPITIVNYIWNSKSPVAVACFLPGRAKDLSAPLFLVLLQYLCFYNNNRYHYQYHTHTNNFTAHIRIQQQ
jgi:hypothetical protein